MNDNLKPVVVGVVALIACGVLIGTLRRGCASSERYALASSRTDEALVTRLAQAVSQEQEKGTVVLIRYTGFIPSTEALQEVQVRAFKRALPGGYDVVELPPASMPQDAHGNWVLRTSGGNWGADLVEWMGEYSDAVAVVSLVGVPNLSPAQWEALPPFYGAVIVAHPYHDELLQRGLLKGLAVAREDGDAIAIRKFRGSKEELFGMAYEYRTPAQ